MTWATDVATASGTIVAAVASAVAAVYSAKATRGWRDGLQQQRADEFAIALENCAAAIGRTVSRKRNLASIQPADPHYDLGLDDAWASWARTQAAFKVAQRYYPKLNSDFLESGAQILHRLGDFCAKEYNEAVGIEINGNFGEVNGRSMDLLK